MGIAFDEFWKIYPRKTEKIAARTAFDRALRILAPDARDEAARTAAAQIIIEGARRYANEMTGNMKFTKYPATWLNAGCWDDEPGANRGNVVSEKTPAEIAREATIARYAAMGKVVLPSEKRDRRYNGSGND